MGGGEGGHRRTGYPPDETLQKVGVDNFVGVSQDPPTVHHGPLEIIL